MNLAVLGKVCILAVGINVSFLAKKMMKIYSNSFFHFTNNLEHLKEIIHTGFNVYFCKEEVYSTERNVVHIGIPMVSFCDTPLLYLTQNSYGKYCIGMKRKWAVEHQLQPVLYYPNNQEFQSTKMIVSATEDFLNDKKDTDKYRILGYSKPLYKIECDKETTRDNYVEREWRKVYASRNQFVWLTEDEYDVYRGDKSLPKTPIGVPLKFSAEDVDIIIVQERDIVSLIDYIMRGGFTYIGGKENTTVDVQDRELLLSKVATFESLANNM